MLKGTLLATVLACVLAPAATASPQEDLALDLQDWFIGYGDLWWEPGAEELAELKEHYHLPYYLLLETGPHRMNEADLDHFLATVGAAENWRGSRIVRMSATLLNSRSGRVEAEWQDFADSGEARGACFAYEYAVGRFDEGWKIVTSTQRPCPMQEAP